VIKGEQTLKRQDLGEIEVDDVENSFQFESNKVTSRFGGHN
jgi:hypothetical protein